MGENHEHTKDRVRRAMRAARSGLSAADVGECSAAACGRIVSLPAFARARYVVAYVVRDNEIDPALAVNAARAAGKAVYYPGRDGDFRSAEDGAGSSATLSPGAAEVLFLVPGLAFDDRGVRLGRGGGWYDRALARHGSGTRVGLAYEFQIVPALPEGAWDVRMDVVVTEARLLAPYSAAPAALKENSR